MVSYTLVLNDRHITCQEIVEHRRTEKPRKGESSNKTLRMGQNVMLAEMLHH